MSHDSSLSPTVASLRLLGSSIFVGHESLARTVKPLLAVCRNRQVAIVTTAPIRRRYGAAVRTLLQQAGITPLVISVPDGERAKTLKWASRLYDRLLTAKIERGSTLIALGGGVVGDLTGFVASTYLRGVAFVQIPTTLVAQVDASIGGKTGVNHPKGKNLIGTFYQPRLVFIDVAMLRTLPKRELIGGMAEVVKYGVIADPVLFEFVERHASELLDYDMKALEHIVARSARIKAGVVSKDERESGLRRILNYGHTLGHAIEAVTGYGRIHHGEAVAIGMQFAARLSVRLGCCNDEVARRQRQLLNRLKLQTELHQPATVRTLLSAMTLDKKVRKGRVHFILPKKIGQVIVKPVEFEIIKEVLKDFAHECEGK